MISILVPTLGEREFELKRLFNSLEMQSYKEFEVVVITQDNHEKVEEILSKYMFRCQHIKSDKRGLSLARNLGLKVVSGNIILFSDDDAWYNRNSMEIINESFYNSNNHVICFKIYDPKNECYYKNYSKHKEKVGRFQIIKKSSIEIAVNSNIVLKEQLSFDERFGLGTTYKSGEENIFLNNILKKGIKIKYVNKVIVNHKIKNSLIIDEQYIKTKTTLYCKLFNKFMSFIMINALILKHRKKCELGYAKSLIIANKEIFI